MSSNRISWVAPDDLLSVSWVGKLLDCFLCRQEEFRAIVRAQKTQVLRPLLDRMVFDYFDRSVKALDVCNAIRDGIEQIRQWQKLLEIIVYALGNQRSIGEGQFRRARKALVDLAIGMLDDKDSNASIANRNRSFGRNTSCKDHHHSHRHFRSLSWSVSRT
ncbi:uncharacterized protein LOC106762011 [Vigna radiata var. radiata]|uniref:Uncharacterized protein LOC106762011 n=1 Tax=Vigna radiata var. radiata TaxID=3916 RepID=A0A1S3U593_VIGRR|nr:uncharacterized protein LOC106762011 [Vigna radiata var. radiata]